MSDETIGFIILGIILGGAWYLGFIQAFFCGLTGYDFEECTKCGKRVYFHEENSKNEGEIIDERYEHQNKDGSPDLRYSDNSFITTYKIQLTCKRCGTNFNHELRDYS